MYFVAGLDLFVYTPSFVHFQTIMQTTSKTFLKPLNNTQDIAMLTPERCIVVTLPPGVAKQTLHTEWERDPSLKN